MVVIMGALFRVRDDLFHIAKRLKSIDRRYELFFNRIKRRFEIYADGAMQIALPFDRLDARTTEFAKQTRLEYAEKFIEDMEKENRRIDEANSKRQCDRLLAQTEGAL